MQRNIAAVAPSLAEIAAQHEVIFTHGNGPQIGLLALQAEAYSKVPPYPLDVLGAETEGMIGYLVEQELGDPAFSEQLPLLQPPMEQRRSRRRSSPSYLFRTVTPPPASCTSSGRASPNRYEHGALWDRLGYRD